MRPIIHEKPNETSASAIDKYTLRLLYTRCSLPTLPHKSRHHICIHVESLLARALPIRSPTSPLRLTTKTQYTTERMPTPEIVWNKTCVSHLRRRTAQTSDSACFSCIGHRPLSICAAHHERHYTKVTIDEFSLVLLPTGEVVTPLQHILSIQYRGKLLGPTKTYLGCTRQRDGLGAINASKPTLVFVNLWNKLYYAVPVSEPRNFSNTINYTPFYLPFSIYDRSTNMQFNPWRPTLPCRLYASRRFISGLKTRVIHL